MRAFLAKTRLFLELIRFSHTVFALPFALLSVFLAAQGFPPPRRLAWILVAMVAARSAAMAFNRLADEVFDAANPRTVQRHLPRGILRRGEVGLFTLGSAALFVTAASFLNPLTFALAPLALVVILGYSYSKRFTCFSHLWLGLALALAPVGAWIAVTGSFAATPVWLGLAVLLWTAGFDILYACQDREFDLRAGLHSIPARLGIRGALRISAALHVLTLLALAAFLLSAQRHAPSWIGLAGVSALLLHEHRIVRPDDLQRVQTAFFTLNAWISFGMLAAGLLDLWLFPPAIASS
ncbi:MAG: UbiA family prenyltransferase [Planctomycetes bacterium]|nr:UbiA family prenyltransferase [Planctomycetota bacterium]